MPVNQKAVTEATFLTELLALVRRHTNSQQKNDPTTRRITMAFQITDDQDALLVVTGGNDSKGAPTGAIGDLSAAIDNAEWASVQPEVGQQGTFRVRPLAPPAGAPAQRLVTVTVTDAAAGVSTPYALLIVPGDEATLDITASAVPPLAVAPDPAAPAVPASSDAAASATPDEASATPDPGAAAAA